MIKYKFSNEESEFVAALLRHVAESEQACITSDGTMCPFWDPEKDKEDGSNESGECLAKRQDKTCQKLQYLLDEEYILEIREKNERDYEREKQIQMRVLQSEINQLDMDRQKIQHSQDKLKRKLEKLAKKEDKEGQT